MVLVVDVEVFMRLCDYGNASFEFNLIAFAFGFRRLTLLFCCACVFFNFLCVCAKDVRRNLEDSMIH